MAFKSPHMYVTMGGTAGATEIWQTGCRFANGSTSETFPDWGDLVPSAFGDAAELLVDSLTAIWPNDISLSWVKIARVATTGLYAGDPIVYELPAPVYGSSSTFHVPLQVAYCVSLRSTATIGRATHGRMYLPSLDISRTSGAVYYDYAVADTIAAAMAVMLSEWEDACNPTSTTRHLYIMSKIAGAVNPVSSIKVGKTADTIRDRRNASPEVYQSTVYPPV